MPQQNDYRIIFRISKNFEIIHKNFPLQKFPGIPDQGFLLKRCPYFRGSRSVIVLDREAPHAALSLFFISKVDGIETDSGIVKDLYDLIEKYHVPVPPEDLAIFSTLKPAVQGLRSSVDKIMSTREQYIDKFCRNLDRDIMELAKEVKEIKNEAQNPMILDPNTEESQVKAFLGELLGKLGELQQKANTYKTYQKNFKVRVMYVSSSPPSPSLSSYSLTHSLTHSLSLVHPL